MVFLIFKLKKNELLYNILETNVEKLVAVKNVSTGIFIWILIEALSTIKAIYIIK